MSNRQQFVLVRSLGLVLGMLGVLLSSVAYASIGQFIYVIGDVRVVDASGASKAAARGMAVNEGDAVITAPGAQAQLRMVDKGFIAVRPDTQMKFDQYKFSGKDDGSENVLMSIVKGGFRSITGLIGSRDRSKYAIRTPAATIGIRGTDKEIIVVPESTTSLGGLPIRLLLAANTAAPVRDFDPSGLNGLGLLAQAGGINPGTFAFVNVGAITMQNKFGSFDVGAKQAGFAPPMGPPVLIPVQQFQRVSQMLSQAPALTAPAEKPAAKPGAVKPGAEKPAALKPGAAAPQKPAVAGAGGEAGAGAGAREEGGVRSVAVVDNTARVSGVGTGAQTGGAAPGVGSSAATTSTPSGTEVPGGGVTISATAPSVTGGLATLNVSTQEVTDRNLVLDLQTNTITNINTGQVTNAPPILTSDGKVALQPWDALAADAAAKAKAAYDAALAAANLAQTASTGAGTANTTASGLSTVSTVPATTAISAATSAISSASTAVTAANALSLSTVKSTTDANATTAAALQSTATGQVTTATAANSANGSFADAQAGPALAAMTAAKGTLDSAVGSVSVAKGTVDTQVTQLTSAQSAATSALGNANTQLTSAQTSLSTANTANSQITTQQTAAATAASTASTKFALAQAAAGSGTTALDPNPTTANSSFASGCGAAKACADLAAQYAAVAISRQAANDFTGAETAYNNALIAASKAATFQATATTAKTDAQTAQNSAQTALVTAQTAVTTATNAVNAAASAAGTGATGAQAQASTASTQAAAAQNAYAAATPVPASSDSALAAAQAAAATLAQKAAIAQYNNPVYDTAKPNQFGSNVLAVNAGQTNNQVKADATGNTHSTYVLDGSRSLIEIRNSASSPAVGGGTAVVASGAGSSASTPSDAGMIFNANGAGVAADNSGTTLVDATRGSIYFGRWQGGTISVTGASPFTIDLGTGTGARSAHWLIGYQPTPSFVQSRMGTATYTLAGGTKPTDAAGIVGTLSSATLTANFDALPQVISSVNLGITFPSRTFNVAATNVPISGNGFTSTTTPTCTGCSGAWSAVLAGNFMRSDVTALGLTYALTQAPASTPNAYVDQVQGVAVLTTPTAPAEAPTLGAALAAKASAQAAYDAAVLAANATQTASTAANTAKTTAQGLLPVDTTPVTSAISTATPLISGASTAVTAANALSLTAVKSATDANAATAATVQSTAASQVTSATSVNTANGAFADTLAGPALTAMTSAKGTLDSAVSSVSSAKNTVDTQVTALASAQPAATTALANANTQLTNAQGSLTTANDANSTITTQQATAVTAANTASTQLGLAQAAVGSGATSLDPSPTTANSSIASGCATALACSDLASQYASATSTALGVGDVPGAVNAKNNAVTAAQRADAFKTAAANAQATAQSAQTTAQNALAAAQTAVSTATSAVNAGATAGTTAQSEATTASTQAAAAQTAVSNATAAQTTSNSSLTSAQTAALTVEQQAVIAQYNNPALATANGFGHIVASSEPVAAGSNRKADGAGLSNANTKYVLDGQKNLVEMRQTTYKSGAFSATPTRDVASADVKFANGTAADTFNQPGEIYLGRWQGGDVQVDDLSNGAGTDFTINLGSGASAQSAHWMIFRQPATTNYAQTKLTGTASYTLLAATKPTDTSGAVGTGATASLTANFDAPSVSASVTAAFTNKSVAITALNMPIVGNSFSGTTSSAACTGAGCANATYDGEIIGGFGKVDASAAGFSYGMWAPVTVGSTYTDLIRGVVALSTTDTLALRPQPDMNFATAYHYSGGTSTNSFQAIGNAGYSLDGNGNLTQVLDTEAGSQQQLSAGTATPATASQTAALADGSKISFGRWSGVGVTGLDSGAAINRTVLGSYHWVGGAAQTPFFTADALNVTAKYVVTGNTAPTDQSDAAGTFNSATLTVDFGRQAVNASVNVTTAAGVWNATGTDVALSGGRFWANKGSTAPYSGLAITLGGSVTGTNGSLSGTLMGDRGDGAGMTYAFSQGTNTVAGAVALQATAGVQGAGQSVPTPNPTYAVGIVAAGNLAAFSATDADYARTVIATINPAPGSRDVNGQVYSFNAEAPAIHAGGVATVPALYELAPNSLGPTPPGPGAAVSPSALTNTGSEATTGISWGRYNGFVFYNDRIAGNVAGSFDVRTGQAGKSGNWHGIWSPDQTGAPVLPLSGTYTQIGGTFATDNKGGVSSVVPTATLTANFTSMTVDAGVSAVISGGTSPGTWTAAATNVPIQQRTYFDTKAVTVTAPIAGATAGKITGVFTGGQSGGPAPGAIMGYSLNAGGATGTTVSGVSAFKR